eukprot:UN23957
METGILVSDSTGGVLLRAGTRSNQIKFQSAGGTHIVRAFISDARGATSQYQLTITVEDGEADVANPLSDLNSLASQVASSKSRMTLTQRNSYMDALSQLLTNLQQRRNQTNSITTSELSQFAGISYSLVDDTTKVDKSKIRMMTQLLDTIVSLSSNAPDSKRWMRF